MIAERIRSNTVQGINPLGSERRGEKRKSKRREEEQKRESENKRARREQMHNAPAPKPGPFTNHVPAPTAAPLPLPMSKRRRQDKCHPHPHPNLTPAHPRNQRSHDRAPLQLSTYPQLSNTTASIVEMVDATLFSVRAEDITRGTSRDDYLLALMT